MAQENVQQIEAQPHSQTILVIAPHPDDDVLGCGAFLLHASSKDLACDIHVAYAVSGFDGVSDKFLEKLHPGALDRSLKEIRSIKTKMREQEALSSCRALGAMPHFWKLPFYEKREGLFERGKRVGSEDLSIIEASIKKINPTKIFLIDETSDPHGTHGVISTISLQTLKNIKYSGKLYGYRVWDEGYDRSESDLVFSFSEEEMREKELLVGNHVSQIVDPAFPHKKYGFIELMKKANREQAVACGESKLYAECFRNLKK